MTAIHGARTSPETAKLLTLIVAVIALFAAAYAVFGSEQTSADATPSETYFYDQLSTLEKSIVDELADGYTVSETAEEGLVVSFEMDMTSTFAGQTVDQASSTLSTATSHVLRVVYWEHPEYYWFNISGGVSIPFTYEYEGENLGGNTVITALNATVKFIHCYADHGTTYADINANVTAIKNAISATSLAGSDTYNTVKNIHDYTYNLLSYTTADPIPSGPALRNLYTALLDDHVVVCEAYAKVFKALCDNYDIPCVIMTGDAGTTGEKEGHMWNYVYMSGNWYHVDCTWDDQETMVTTYFLAGSTTVGFNSVTVADTYTVETETTDLFTVPTLSTVAYVNSTFTVTFLNYDGSTIETQTDIAYQAEIVAPTATYVDANIGTFTFNSWSPAFVSTVTGDATYTATYDIEYVEYYVKFYSDGEEYSSKTDYHYGDLVSIPTTNPSKAASDIFTYTFTGWDPAIDEGATVTGNAEYNAVYECTANAEATGSYTLSSAVLTQLSSADKFSVTIKNDSGTAIAKIVFSKDAISGLVADQTLTVTQATTEAVAESLREQLSEATIYQIDFGSNNDKFSSGTATVSLYYVKTALDAIGGLNLYYVNGETLESLAYNYADNYITFETTHFSTYAINNAMGLSGFMWYVPIIAILIFAFIGFALAYRFG